MANRTLPKGAPRAAARKPRGVSTRPSAARVTVDPLDRRLETAQRAVLVGVTALVGVVVYRPLVDPFMLPKITIVVVGVVALLALAAVRAVRSSALTVPAGAPAVVAAVLAVALVVAALGADNLQLAFVGRHKRYSGLLSYASYVVVFLFCLRLFATGQVRRLMQAVVVASLLVSAYGLIQVAGLDPYSWSARLDETVFSTLGNTNFAAAYVAVTLPVAAAVLIGPRWSLAWRVVSGALLVLGSGYIVATEAAQGPIAAAAGLAVVGVAWLLLRQRAASASGKASRVSALWLLAGGLGAAVVLLLLGLRLAPDVLDSSLGERLQFWEAALRIFADHPLIGSGLDSYRDYFLSYRPLEHGVERGYQGADSSHNLPLGMLAAGGLLLGLSYLAFVGFTGWTLLRGLRTVPRDRVLPLAGFGGMWAAYQVQSLVSIDVPALAFHHFLAAGVIFALCRSPQTATLPLPLAPASRGRLLPTPSAGGRRAVAAGVLAAVSLVALGAAWVGTRPLRADLSANAGKKGEGLPAYDRAVELAPWEAEYRLLQANARNKAGMRSESFAAQVAATDLRLGSSKLALGLARQALRADDQEAAQRWIDTALRRDPNNPEAFEDAAKIETEAGNSDLAAQYTQRAKELRAAAAAP